MSENKDYNFSFATREKNPDLKREAAEIKKQIEDDGIPIFGGITVLREQKGWRQSTLALRAGVSQSLVSRLEKGQVLAPRLKQLEQIARVLGTSVEELKTGSVKTGSTKKPNNEPAHHFLEAESIQFRQETKIPLFGQKIPLSEGFSAVLRDYNTAKLILEPPILQGAQSCFAIQMVDDSMMPRYRRGDTLFVNPNINAMFDDDVVIELVYGLKSIMLVREIAHMDVIDDDTDPKVIHETILPTQRDATGVPDFDKALTFLEGDQSVVPMSKKTFVGIETPRFPKRRSDEKELKLERVDVHVIVGSYRYRDTTELDVSGLLKSSN